MPTWLVHVSTKREEDDTLLTIRILTFAGDLLIIAGTSLVVSPANSLVTRVPSSTRRIVINNEPVGTELGLQYGSDGWRDSFIPGECERTFLDLTTRLGWLEELAGQRAMLPDASQIALDAALDAIRDNGTSRIGS